MDWLQWIVPIIVVAGWIIGMMAKSREGQKRQPAPKPPRPPEEPTAQSAPRPQRTSPEMDRFLEEVRRRQQQSAPMPRAADSPRPQPAPRPVARIPAPAKPSRLPERGWVPLLTSAPTATLPTQTLPTVASAPMPPLTTVTVSTPRPVTQAVHQVRAMLQNPQSLAASMILREIFDKPVSRRPRRR